MDCRDTCPEIKALEERIARLEAIIMKNSRNSSKPPSSDKEGKKKTKSQRGKSGKKSGGQEGHKGKTLKRVETPDHIEIHQAPDFCTCGCHLKDIHVLSVENRQVFDIPPVSIEVTEHQVESKICPHCKTKVSGSFPDGLNQPVQYGSRIKAAVLYFSDYQLLPMLRISELFRDIFGHGLSEGTINRIRQNGAEQLLSDHEQRKAELINSPVVHFDESGVRVESTRKWLHSAGNENCTVYYIHDKRGSEAMNDMGILPSFEGCAGHDFWKPYYKYKECAHFLCNSHHLRELTFIDETENHEWAKKMSSLLLQILQKRNNLVEQGYSFMPHKLSVLYMTHYKKILLEWEKFYPPPENIPGKRGRKKQLAGKNLLDRLKNNEVDVLRFMYDFDIPFSNNLAERDVRMIKVKGKISGCFRTMNGAQRFAIIRGFISTVRKKGLDLLDQLYEVFQNPTSLLKMAE